MAIFKCPRKIYIVSLIPKTATGKVQRRIVASKIKELYKASAEQGYPRAQIKYATMLFIKRNFFMAYVWSHIAHKNGHKKALGIRDEQASMLSKRQVFHAKRHAIACKYRNYKEC